MSAILRLSLAAVLLAGPAAADTVTVFAAASLKDAMDRIAPAFHEATGHDLAVSLAGSSALARQIEAGAPADVFISANETWMDHLDDAGLIAADTRFDLAGNALVMAGPDGAAPVVLDDTLTATLGEGKLAMALVDAVPAGIYGKAALSSLGLWDAVAPQVAQADNVRAALALVAMGAAPLGIVYATDAAAEPRVDVVATFPADSHDAILYPAAALAGHEGAAAAAFLDYLQGDEAGAVLTELGFTLPQ
ncbi:molybdate ABC transporter substrate-binding protein [Mangrovicoccus algicola]|uniref:Molybdate-binding protein ModA n=1 Tax=Mangrovicoccus algicola TaxID=2771008 RepID=A0A8J6YVH3_9RHOB|nr:molybdate ABC transporter substrate-binding protein [Mangrovicoccus algicola]MBE3639993.1 molybdate ABC transporter substrate-binding protein [Mangrovicoccus algicola]